MKQLRVARLQAAMRIPIRPCRAIAHLLPPIGQPEHNRTDAKLNINVSRDKATALEHSSL